MCYKKWSTGQWEQEAWGFEGFRAAAMGHVFGGSAGRKAQVKLSGLNWPKYQISGS